MPAARHHPGRRAPRTTTRLRRPLGACRSRGATGRELLIVAERERYVERFGTRHPLPVKVVQFAWPRTRRRLLRLLPEAALRTGQDGAPLVTDERLVRP